MNVSSVCIYVCVGFFLLTGEVLFYGGSLVIYILFVHLAREWPQFMAKWELMEREMRRLRNPPKTAYKFKMITSIIMFLSIGTYNIKIFLSKYR
jgi:gustatory receptor